jgi:hypothetical protein
MGQTEPAGTAPASVEKVMRAVRASSPVELDGVLTDPAWALAEPIADFVQQEPDINQPVSQPTQVRVLFDDEALYFGIRCEESTPGGVTARELRRDNALTNDDRFEIVLDTFHDHRNAFYFVINPLGTQYDALITDEGQDVNAEWDERWWAETEVTNSGWTAEIKIPFTTLRSPEGADTFGVNFKRFIRRRTETAQWTGWDRDFFFVQVSQAGHLQGLNGIETGLKLRIKPFGLGGFRRPGDADTDGLNDVGLEVMKFSLTPTLTSELTLNTDFAQTEVDEAIVNLTRFPVFFPEKREFFLERAGIFEFGLGGRRGGTFDRFLQMYFSRRIGLTEDRRPVPILAGGKLIGHTAGMDLGVLNVQTDDFNGVPGSNYTVVRAKRNVLARSNYGLFTSNRQSSGDDYNRVLGGDVNFTLGKNTDLQGFVAKSWTPGRTGNDYAGRAKYNWFSDIYELFLEHLYIGEDFQHDVGFIRRRDIRRTDAVAVWEPRPEAFNVRNLVFRGEITYLTDIGGRLQTREQIFQFTSRHQSDDAWRINFTRTLDVLDQPFEIAPGIRIPIGEYTFLDTWGELEASGARLVAGRLRAGAGDFYGGTRRYVQLTPSVRPWHKLSLETSYEYNDVDLPQGHFLTHVLNARLNFNLSNRWLTTTLAQYDSTAERHVLFFRLNYIYRPGDDLFIVFNRSTEETGTPRDPDYTLMVKLTYSVDF